MSYYLSETVDAEFDETVEVVRELLADEGFGVLCEIDVQATLQEKLGIEEFRDYLILGACNPPLAHQAMQAEVPLGTLLPCNVVVYAGDDGRTVVAAVDPETLLSVVDGGEDLDEVAADVRERFGRILADLTAATAA